MLTATAKYIHHTTEEKTFKAKTPGGQDRRAFQTEVSFFEQTVGKTFVMRMLTAEPPLHMAKLQPMDDVLLQLGVRRGDWDDEISLENVRSAVKSSAASPAGK
jgi:hypothetical protein